MRLGAGLRMPWAGLGPGLRMRLAAVVTAGLARPPGVLLSWLARLPPLGKWFTLRIFLFLQELLDSAVNIRQLRNPVA